MVLKLSRRSTQFAPLDTQITPLTHRVQLRDETFVKIATRLIMASHSGQTTACSYTCAMKTAPVLRCRNLRAQVLVVSLKQKDLYQDKKAKAKNGYPDVEEAVMDMSCEYVIIESFSARAERYSYTACYNRSCIYTARNTLQGTMKRSLKTEHVIWWVLKNATWRSSSFLAE